MSTGTQRPVLPISVAVVGLFVASCWLPAGYWSGPFVEEGVNPDGWRLVLLGWLALPLAGVAGLAWFANPLLGFGLVYWRERRYGMTAVLAGAAVALSLLPLALLPDSWTGEFRPRPTPAWVFREGRLQFMVGYFVWVGSHVLLLVAAVWRFRIHVRASDAEPGAAHDPAA